MRLPRSCIALTRGFEPQMRRLQAGEPSPDRPWQAGLMAERDKNLTELGLSVKLLRRSDGRVMSTVRSADVAVVETGATYGTERAWGIG